MLGHVTGLPYPASLHSSPSSEGASDVLVVRSAVFVMWQRRVLVHVTHLPFVRANARSTPSADNARAPRPRAPNASRAARGGGSDVITGAERVHG